MELTPRALIVLTTAGLVADAALSGIAIASLELGTSPVGYGLMSAANITAMLLAVFVASATVRIQQTGRVRLVGLTIAALLSLAGVRVVGLAVVLFDINSAQQLQSLSAILLAIIGAALTIVVLPIMLVAASVGTNWIRRFRITHVTTTQSRTV